jgi:hypothetical protein
MNGFCVVRGERSDLTMRRASRLARWATLLLVSSVVAFSSHALATDELLHQRMNDLEAELQALKQQLHGAAVLGHDLASAGKGWCSCLWTA